MNVLTGCAVGNVTSVASSVARTPMAIQGVVHGGQNAIGGSLIQLWETGGGTAGAGATATATVGTGAAAGTITSIALGSAGSGYTSAPTVTITDSTGTGATATAVLSATDGTIASITVTNGGVGYTAPTVALTGGIAANGYGQGAIQLVASTTTAAGSGAFSFPSANVSSNCLTGPYTYITGTGGDPSGNTQNNVNSSIELAAIIGPCSSTGAGTNVTLNELTTVAAAYALGNFATDSSGTINIGAPLTNSLGLSDAIANAGLLVNTTTGTANLSTPARLLPTAMILSLGNALAACVNSATPFSQCTSLFSYTTPPGGSAPTDTFQAAVNMAKYPGNNVPGILQLGSAVGGAFVGGVSTTSTTATTAPNDITLGIVYLDPTLNLASTPPVSLAIDGSDNVWVLGASSSTYNYITELTSASNNSTITDTLGSTATLNSTHTVRFGAFDTSGNFFLSDKNSTAGSIIEIAAGNTVAQATELTPFSTTLDPNDWMVALDASQNLWTASYGGLGNCTATSGNICEYVEYQRSGTSYSPVTTFGTTPVAVTSPSVRGIAADAVSTSAGVGNVWTTNYGVIGSASKGTKVEVLTPTSGAVATYTIGTAADEPMGVALDASGNAYITTNYGTDGLYKVPQGTTTASTISSTVSTSGQSASSLSGIPNANSSVPASNATTKFAIGGLNNGPGYDAIDGAGNVWVANDAYGSLVEYSPSLSAFLSPYYGFSPGVAVTPATLVTNNITINSGGTSNIYVTGYTAYVGELVTFNGFSGNYAFLNNNTFTISGLSANYFTIPTPGQGAQMKTPVTGNVAFSNVAQTVFTCGSTAPITCTIANTIATGNNTVGIDRAGSVWTLGTNGYLMELIGTAAPTNPVLSAGQSGTLP
jgi:hypothetical protein